MKTAIAPAAEAAERAVLGACLADPSCYWRAAEIVGGEHFYDEPNRHVFQAMADLASSNVEIDLLTVTDRMSAAGTLKAAGGTAYVASLADGLPDPANVEHYARIVREHANRRDLMEIGRQLYDSAQRGAQPPQEIGEVAVNAILRTTDVGATDDAGDMGDILAEVLKDAEQRKCEGKGLTGWRTGVPGIDAVMKPMRPGQLITIGGGTGTGKTSLALQIAGNVVRAGGSVYYATLEMLKGEVTTRFAAQQVAVGSTMIELFSFAADELQRLLGLQDYLQERPRAWVDGYRAMTLARLQARAKARKQRWGGLDLLIVDYLQLMLVTGKADNRTGEVSQITRGLKVLAGTDQLNVPVLALSQLSRDYDRRAPGSGPPSLPRKYDLRESGSIEQDSDVVLLLHRDTRPEATPEERREAKVVVAKQRSGREAEIVNLLWHPDWQSFE